MDKLRKEFKKKFLDNPTKIGPFESYDFYEIWQWIETAISKAREEGFKEGRKIITKDIVEAMKLK